MGRRPARLAPALGLLLLLRLAPASRAWPAAPAPARAGPGVCGELCRALAGSYDNAAQSAADAAAGRALARGDGHEHIRVEVRLAALPVPGGDGEDDWGRTLIAKYSYVEPQPAPGPGGGLIDVFRYRWYTLREERPDAVRMRIHRVLPALEEELRAEGSWLALEKLHYLAAAGGATEYLPTTDVIWTRVAPGTFQGDLADGEVLVPSQRDASRLLRVTDDLRVSPDFLYINDRVEDAETGALFYGNAEGVPYELARMPSSGDGGGGGGDGGGGGRS